MQTYDEKDSDLFVVHIGNLTRSKELFYLGSFYEITENSVPFFMCSFLFWTLHKIVVLFPPLTLQAQWSFALTLTLSFIMLKNGQTYFKDF